MARKLRVQYPGAIYHVMNRGEQREPIFEDDVGRERFLETLAEACLKSAYEIHASCLILNHFLLVVETLHANLAPGMKWFLGGVDLKRGLLERMADEVGQHSPIAGTDPFSPSDSVTCTSIGEGFFGS